MTEQIQQAKNSKGFIEIKGARLHNLKNIDVNIPRNQLVVITGLSGSGKSSLAFDTLYAEGQRRYVESLSSYARQFLGRLNKPEVDSIKGIAPAIAIEQKVNSRNPRSTVGTTTEIYDYLKLLFARIGKTYSPISNTEVSRNTTSDVIDFIQTLDDTTRFQVLSPIQLLNDRTIEDQLAILRDQGYSRVSTKDQIFLIDDLLENKNIPKTDLFIVIDRLTAARDEDNINRIADSIQTSFYEGKGYCIIDIPNENAKHEFSNKFEADGMLFEEPTEHLFSFNNPIGACPKCEGYGSIIGVDEGLVIPNTGLSVYDDAIVCWKGEKMSEWKDQLVMSAYKFDFPVHTAYYQLTEEQKTLIWEGNSHFKGINEFFTFVESNSYKIQYRVMLSRYRGKTICTTCNGTRLKKEASYIKIGEQTLPQLVNRSIEELKNVFDNIELDKNQEKIAKRLLVEIKTRLKFIDQVGLGYLTLNRLSSTLSGGESQRINLATSLGSSLVGSMYILDEPSIGLHPKDTERLIEVLKSLRDLGNTVIVVEHEEEVMKAADYIIDIGPEAGSLGGNVVFEGIYSQLLKSDSLTGQYLSGTLSIPVPEFINQSKEFITIKGAREHNLKNIDVSFQLGGLTVVSGVSGSGKSTLVKDILYPGLKRIIDETGIKPGQHDKIEGSIDQIKHIEFVDQNPIGKSSRSNPVTYVKAYDEIRSLFASTKSAQLNGFKTKHFSFNVEGGRCATCQGEGTTTVGMQFMADIQLVCETCEGKRFKEEVLSVKFEDKNISDILDLTINQAIAFFNAANQTKIVDRLQPLQDVGLGYVHMGQSSNTLSGGEAQRVKLATFLGKGQNSNQTTLFIFDEPTTGLHFHDVQKLLTSFNALIDKGHSIVVIEHNMEVIKCADWLIDLGPDGGENGGSLLFSGPRNEINASSNSKSHTIQHLLGYL
ncbi:MAG: excinuclease ABC subunit A [Flavobacteriales bacterium]|jgi:excinuclease ABC subunit A